MVGLIIKEAPLEKIFSGKKTWEMRGKKTTRRGLIALIEKGTGQIVGAAELKEVVGPLSPKQLRDNVSKHQGDEESVNSKFGYKKHVYGWVLTAAKRFAQPIPYKHPSGAVIWVKLDTSEKDIQSSFQN